MPDEQARIDAVKRFLAATQGEAAANAKVATLRTVGDLVRVEQEVSAWRNTVKPSSASPPAPAAAAAPQPQADGRVSEEQYARMSHAERLDYCRGFRNP
jgi:hypothetical protein